MGAGSRAGVSGWDRDELREAFQRVMEVVEDTDFKDMIWIDQQEEWLSKAQSLNIVQSGFIECLFTKKPAKH